MKKKLAYSNLLFLLGIISSVWLIFEGWFNDKTHVGVGITLLCSNISFLCSKYEKKKAE
ncbi:MAG: hypothetical protein IJJ04_01275 [Clostridia bacterium]|nr:hypothetical protein [Clostridia bacterium]